MGIKEEITKIAVEQGYEGAKPKSIAQAIDALTDTLAGEDVKSGRSVVDAIRKYAPYIGSGGGSERVKLFNETVTTEDDGGWAKAILSFTGDITDDPLVVVFDGTEYELPRSEAEGLMGKTVTYGTSLTEDGPDFSTYPLAIKSGPNAGEWRVYTKTAGTHTIIAYTDGSGGGGAEQYGTGIEMSIKGNISLTFAVLTTTDVTDGDSYKAATIGSVEFTATPNGKHCFVKGGAHIAVSGLGNEFDTATMTLDDAEFTDFEVKTIGIHTYVLFTVPETGNPDSYLVLHVRLAET